MKGLDSLDWIVIVAYFVVLLGIAAWVIMQKQKNTPTHARISWVRVISGGILIEAIGLYDANGEYIRDAKLNGDLLCTLTETLLPITICK